MFKELIAIALSASVLSLLYGLLLIRQILKRPEGNKRMIDVAKSIREGAMTFLNRMYSAVAVVAAVLFVILLYVLGWKIAVGFLIGAVFSALTGYVGMNISVRANVRTAEACKKDLSSGLSVAFKAGTVTGLFVAGLGLLTVSVFYAIFRDTTILIGLGFGGSLISIFARLGGGIFTKGADVGADLVGKIEAGIPEDDLRNPAVIADNVGDNVGDCAGMAADLFETYTVTMIATMVLGSLLFSDFENAVLYPLILGAVSIVTSIVGGWFVRLFKKSKNIMAALYRGLIISIILSAISFYFITNWIMVDNRLYSTINLYLVSLIGLVVAVLLVIITEYYTSYKYTPVKLIAKSSSIGHSANVITGLSYSMRSTAMPILVIGAGILGAFSLAGLYGVAIATTSMLSIAGIMIAMDAFGPIVDNAGGIAEMSGLPDEVRVNTDALDSVGNTTKAITKGYAIGSAGLAAIVLFAGYTEKLVFSGSSLKFDLTDPYVLVGLFIGGMLPYYFASLAMESVSRAGSAVVEEVRRQFGQIKGILDGKTSPDYKKTVDIVTRVAIKEMILPASVAVLMPLLLGLILGPVALGGFLIGTIVTGLFVAISMTTGGGAWDNAKKFIEEGNLGGKGSISHKVAITGDTVGDPYKDTAGPAINPIIKVVNIIAILIAPIIVKINLDFTWKIVTVAILILIVVAYMIFGARLKSKIISASE